MPLSLRGWLLLLTGLLAATLAPILAVALWRLPQPTFLVGMLSLWYLAPHYLLAFFLALRALDPERLSFPRTALGALGLILLLHAVMLATAQAAGFLVFGAIRLALAIEDSAAAAVTAWIAAIILTGSLYGLAVDLVHQRSRTRPKSSRRAWRLAHMLGGALAAPVIVFGGPAAARPDGVIILVLAFLPHALLAYRALRMHAACPEVTLAALASARLAILLASAFVVGVVLVSVEVLVDVLQS